MEADASKPLGRLFVVMCCVLIIVWVEGRGAAATPVSLPASLASNPITITDDDCGWNLVAALEANGGALKQVVIPPSQVFSFNATMGDPAFIPYRTCAGIPGGNWCNLAARYAQVARAMGLRVVFEDHGVGDLGGGAENSVAIWNVGGVAGFEDGGQDLLIKNTTEATISLLAIQEGTQVVVVGGIKK